MNTTETGFYRLAGDDRFHKEPLTFCASCALKATNIAFRQAGIEPAETMAEAAAVMTMLLILKGDPEAETLLTYLEHGLCGWCGIGDEAA